MVRTPADGAGAAQVVAVVVDRAVEAATGAAASGAGRLEIAVARAAPTRTSGVLLGSRPTRRRRRLVELGVVVMNAHKITASAAAVSYC